MARRRVAQSGSASALGAEGRWFESGRPDQTPRAGWTGRHAGAHLQASQDRDAAGPRPDEALGTRVRTGGAATDRAADGLDLVARHAPAAAALVRDPGGRSEERRVGREAGARR